MRISNDALAKIKEALKSNIGKFPRVILKNGGCAGNILVLVLDKPEASDEFITQDGVSFAVAENARHLLNDISIDLQPGLCDEIVVHMLGSQTCQCGKSFRI